MPIKDVLSQLMQQLSEMRQTIGRLREGPPEEVRSQIDLALKRHTGSNLALIHALPPDQLLALLGLGGRADAERCLFIAEMLRLEAHVVPLPSESYHKALMLYLAAFDEEEELATEYGDGLAEVVTSVDSVALPAELRRRAFAQLAVSGDYARAEDVLFSLLEAAPDELLLEQGRSFYRTLLSLDDDSLEAGGLPRDEVEEGLGELERRAQG
jgi:hypothetical protein